MYSQLNTKDTFFVSLKEEKAGSEEQNFCLKILIDVIKLMFSGSVTTMVWNSKLSRICLSHSVKLKFQFLTMCLHLFCYIFFSTINAIFGIIVHSYS